MLSVVIFMLLVYQGLSLVSYGTDFVTTFPENIAYYHTDDSMTTLKIAALQNDTTVKVTVNDTLVYNTTVDSGQIQNVHFPITFEQYNMTRFLHCVRVVSTRHIVVLWTTQRGHSIQTNVVQPLENLNCSYLIPALNYSKVIGLPNIADQLASVSVDRTYNTFRVIIINAENQMNHVHVTSVIPDLFPSYSLSLNPYEVQQLYTSSSVLISSIKKVAVLLTHPCMETSGCECNMVVSQVLPSSLWGDKFVIPAPSVTRETWLHVMPPINVSFNENNLHENLESGLISLAYVSNKSLNVHTALKSPLRIVSPGSVIEIIPESMFAACYLVLFNSTEGEIVVIAEKDQQNYVHIDHNPVDSSVWQADPDSMYSSASVSLTGTHVVWHPTLKIGVYMFERMNGGILYGGPAIPLSEVPDRHGCQVEPATFMSGPNPMTWPESHQYCLNETYQLVTPETTEAQREMINWLQREQFYQDIWIGLRRSMLTFDWYWQTGHESIHNVSFTEWAENHPGDPWKAMCASGHLDNNRNFFWRSAACCTKMIPVCYEKGSYFMDFTFETRDDFCVLD